MQNGGEEMKKISAVICDVAPAILIYILVISCFVWFGSELLSSMDRRAEVVGELFSEVGR